MDKNIQLIEDCIKMINETIVERYADMSETQIPSECKKLSKNIRFLNSVNTSLEVFRFGRGGDLVGSLPKQEKNIIAVMSYITDHVVVTVAQLMKVFLTCMNEAELDGILSSLETTEFIKSSIYDGREIIIIRKFAQKRGQHVSKS